MKQNQIKSNEKQKQRVTAFVDPVLVTRAKVQGALEGLTISAIVARALDESIPKIDTKIITKHAKSFVVSR